MKLKTDRPDEALRRLMAKRVGQPVSAKQPPTGSEAFASQLLRQALEGDTKTQKLIIELLQCGEALPGQEAAAQPTEIVLRVVHGDES